MAAIFLRQHNWRQNIDAIYFMTIKHLSFITLKVGPYTKRENFWVLDYIELEDIVKIHRFLELCKENFLAICKREMRLRKKPSRRRI